MKCNTSFACKCILWTKTKLKRLENFSTFCCGCWTSEASDDRLTDIWIMKYFLFFFFVFLFFSFYQAFHSLQHQTHKFILKVSKGRCFLPTEDKKTLPLCSISLKLELLLFSEIERSKFEVSFKVTQIDFQYQKQRKKKEKLAQLEWMKSENFQVKFLICFSYCRFVWFNYAIKSVLRQIRTSEICELRSDSFASFTRSDSFWHFFWIK